MINTILREKEAKISIESNILFTKKRELYIIASMNKLNNQGNKIII